MDDFVDFSFAASFDGQDQTKAFEDRFRESFDGRVTRAALEQLNGSIATGAPLAEVLRDNLTTVLLIAEKKLKAHWPYSGLTVVDANDVRNSEFIR